jgi:hypothetical protein
MSAPAATFTRSASPSADLIQLSKPPDFKDWLNDATGVAPHDDLPDNQGCDS